MTPVQWSFQKTAYYILILTIILVYCLVSHRYTGPAYLSDEIGYLTKAAAFAGYPGDMASSWHGGYSLMIAPAFMIFSDPFVIWQGVIVLNSLMWALSFILLFNLLSNLFPQKNFWAILAAVGISATYPAWITMSGYAFSTPSFVLVYMLALVLLLHSVMSNFCWVLYSIMVGFLYWIHPTGVAVACASLIVSMVLAWRMRQLTRLILHALIIVAMIMTYRFVVHPWLNKIMTPEGYVPFGHYPSFSGVTDTIMTLGYWPKLFVTLLGQLSYILITTFGVAVYLPLELHRRIGCLKRETDGQSVNVFATAAMLFATLSVLAIIVMGSAYFSLYKLQIDEWIYGRYTEAALLPVFAIGVLAFWRFRFALSVAIILVITGFILFIFTNEINTRLINNLVNIQAFWPEAIMPGGTYPIWFIAGSLGVLAVHALGKKYFMLVVLAAFSISITNQASWHSKILDGYSNPTSLVSFIRSNFPSGTCIGFNPIVEKSLELIPERRNLYSFYLYDYDYRRMSPEEWKNTCNGPYLIHSVEDLLRLDNVVIIARGYASHLFLAVKTDALGGLDLASLNRNEYYVDLNGSPVCMIAGCFEMSYKQLAPFSKVGRVTDKGLTSTGVRGYLFYGPYRSLDAGSYYLEIEMDVDKDGNANLDIVSDSGRKKYLDVQVSDYVQTGHNIVRIPFSLNEEVPNLEVRLHVSEDSALTVRSYVLKHNNRS